MIKFARILLTVLRWIIILSAILLIIEALYYHATGNYFIYYRLLLRKAENGAEQIATIYHVFNGRRAWLANCFSNYFIPAIVWVSAILSAFDVGWSISYKEKRQIVMCISNIIALLVMLYIILLF